MIAAPTLRPEGRHAVLVQVCNLSEEERDLLNTTIAVLTDPGLAAVKRDLMEGRVVMVMEGGEVTWEDRP